MKLLLQSLPFPYYLSFSLSYITESVRDVITTTLIKNKISTIMFSEKTIYNYIDAGVFTARNIDMQKNML